jgi:glucose 1-dehydrogenase
MKLAGKIAVVTGAARGIGRGCAAALAEEGADVVINGRPGGHPLDGTAGLVRRAGRKCTPVEADAFSREGCQTVVDAALAAHGRIDILVANPSTNVRQSFLEYDPDDFERVIRGVLLSGFHISQLAARHMAARGGGGKIIFISSIHSFIPFAKSAAYNAGKAGLNALSATIALELAGHRINVNTIDPGWIDTPGERLWFSDEHLAREGAKLPWGRLGVEADIGKACVYLASDDADYVTGAVLRVDGGFWLKDAVE